MTYRGPSEAQGNAEAVARRDRRYRTEHEQSATRTFAPAGFRQLLIAFLYAWQYELTTRLHTSGVEAMAPGRIVRGDGTGVTDPGGGNALGAPRWNGQVRAHLFGDPGRTDVDGLYVEPMHWVVEQLIPGHPLKAAVLRMIGRGGEWTAIRISCPHCGTSVTLPDEYAESITRDALGLAVRFYQDAPGGRPPRA